MRRALSFYDAPPVQTQTSPREEARIWNLPTTFTAAEIEQGMGNTLIGTVRAQPPKPPPPPPPKPERVSVWTITPDMRARLRQLLERRVSASLLERLGLAGAGDGGAATAGAEVTRRRRAVTPESFKQKLRAYGGSEELIRDVTARLYPRGSS